MLVFQLADSIDEFSLSGKNTQEDVTINGKGKEIKETENLPHFTAPEKSKKEEEEIMPPKPSAKATKTKHVKFDNLLEESDDDEDVIELEFERDIKKLDTHAMYCPNCNTCITKVVLRRKRAKKVTHVAQENERADLLGCSACFSVFVPSGKSADALSCTRVKCSKQS